MPIYYPPSSSGDDTVDWDSITNKPDLTTIDWDNVTNKPDLTTIDWDNITDKPTFGTASGVDDNTLVHTTGDETIGGTKTFTSPIVGDGSQLTGKADSTHAVQHDVNGTDSLVVHEELTGTEIDWSKNRYLYKTITEATEFTFTNLTDGRTVMLALETENDPVITWPEGIKWSKQEEPPTPLPTDFMVCFATINGSVYAVW